MSLRASSITLATKCPESISPGLAIDDSDVTAQDGQDIHRAISLTIMGHPTPQLSAESESVVALAYEWFKWLLTQVKDAAYATEVSHHSGDLSGTIDVLITLPDDKKSAVIVDWKATYRDDDHTPQMLAYCKLVMDRNPNIETVTVWVPSIRAARVAEPVTYTRAYVDAWWAEFKRNVLDNPQYRPGEHCDRCRRRTECPALQAVQRDTIAIFSESTELASKIDVAALRPRVKLLKSAIKRYEELEREAVIKGGPIPLDNGKVLKEVTQKNDVIGIREAWDTLQANFTDAEIATFVEVGKGRMLELIAERTERGEKKKAQENFMEILRGAGAVSRKEVTKIMECNP